MANDDTPTDAVGASQSQRLGKLAANPALSQADRKSLVSTQARMPKSEDVENVITNATNSRALGSYKKGGKVKRTGLYKLHAGEKVLTKKAAKRG